jgi:hypothetical protein
VTARSGCGRPPPARGVHELVALEENGPAVLERAVTDRAGAVSRTAPLHNPAGPLAYSRRIRLHLGCPILSLPGPIRVSSARVNPFVVPRHGTPARSGAGGEHGEEDVGALGERMGGHWIFSSARSSTDGGILRLAPWRSSG